MWNRLKNRWHKPKSPTNAILDDDLINGNDENTENKNDDTDDELLDNEDETFNRDREQRSSRTRVDNVRSVRHNRRERTESRDKEKSVSVRPGSVTEDEPDKRGSKNSEESKGKLKRILSIGRKNSTKRNRSPSTQKEVNSNVNTTSQSSSNSKDAKLNSDRELALALRLKQRRSLDSMDGSLSEISNSRAALKSKSSRNHPAMSSFRDDPIPRNIADSVAARRPRPRHSTLDDFLNSIFVEEGESKRQYPDHRNHSNESGNMDRDAANRSSDQWNGRSSNRAKEVILGEVRSGNGAAECAVQVHRAFHDDTASNSTKEYDDDDNDDDDDDDDTLISNGDSLEANDNNNHTGSSSQSISPALQAPPPPPPPPPPLTVCLPTRAVPSTKCTKPGDTSNITKPSPPRLKRRQKNSNSLQANPVKGHSEGFNWRSSLGVKVTDGRDNRTNHQRVVSEPVPLKPVGVLFPNVASSGSRKSLENEGKDHSERMKTNNGSLDKNNAVVGLKDSDSLISNNPEKNKPARGLVDLSKYTYRKHLENESSSPGPAKTSDKLNKVLNDRELAERSNVNSRKERCLNKDAENNDTVTTGNSSLRKDYGKGCESSEASGLNKKSAVITYCISTENSAKQIDPPAVALSKNKNISSINEKTCDAQKLSNSVTQNENLGLNRNKPNLGERQLMESSDKTSVTEVCADVCSGSDGEGRDSGYVTLEDLQAQLGSSDTSSLRSSRYSGSSTDCGAPLIGSGFPFSPPPSSLFSDTRSADQCHTNVSNEKQCAELNSESRNKSDSKLNSFGDITLIPAHYPAAGAVNVMFSGRIVSGESGSMQNCNDQLRCVSGNNGNNKGCSEQALELTFNVKLGGNVLQNKLMNTNESKSCLMIDETGFDEVDFSCRTKSKTSKIESLSKTSLASDILSNPVNFKEPNEKKFLDSQRLLPDDSLRVTVDNGIDSLNRSFISTSSSKDELEVINDKLIHCDCGRTIALSSCPSSPVFAPTTGSLTSNTPTPLNIRRLTSRRGESFTPGGLSHSADAGDLDDVSLLARMKDDVSLLARMKDDGSYLPPLSERSDTTSSPQNSGGSSASKSRNILCQNCSSSLTKRENRSPVRGERTVEDLDSMVEDVSLDLDSVFLPNPAKCFSSIDRSSKRGCWLGRSISEVRRSDVISDVITPSRCKQHRRQCRSTERSFELGRRSPLRSLSSTRSFAGILNVPQKLKNWFRGGEGRSYSRACDDTGLCERCRTGRGGVELNPCRATDEQSLCQSSYASSSRTYQYRGLQTCTCSQNSRQCCQLSVKCPSERCTSMRNPSCCTNRECCPSNPCLAPALQSNYVKRCHSTMCKSSSWYKRKNCASDRNGSISDSDSFALPSASCQFNSSHLSGHHVTCQCSQGNVKVFHKRTRSAIAESSQPSAYKVRSRSSECGSLGAKSRYKSRCSWLIDSSTGRAVPAWSSQVKAVPPSTGGNKSRKLYRSDTDSVSSRISSLFSRGTSPRVFSTDTQNLGMGWFPVGSPPNSPGGFHGVDTMSSSMTTSSLGYGRQKSSGLFGWYTTHCQRISQQNIARSLSQLHGCVWYWGPLSLADAECKLEGRPDGSFIVRDSSDERFLLSLSFRSLNTTHHTRIEHYKGKFCFHAQPQSLGCSTIVDFVESTMVACKSGRCLYYLRPRAPGHSPAPVMLLHPVSRLTYMHSLQHLAKFSVLQTLQGRLHLVDRLPLAPRLKEYLRLNQFGPDPPPVREGLRLSTS